jgi:hypothetical protein
MSSHNRHDTSPVSGSTSSKPSAEDDLADAVERSYAMRLARTNDLSPEERRRIREKQVKSAPPKR